MRLVAVALLAAHCTAEPPPLPEQGTLGEIGSMTEARAAHTATLLPDGRVLLTGGTASSEVGTAELYDPAARRFSKTGSMAAARADHRATLLPDGKVLITGGYNGSHLSDTEVYDPRTGRFASGPAMTEARSGHAAVSLAGGSVLIAGGVGGTATEWVFRASAELYDPAAGRFTAVSSMSAPRESHTATLLPGGEVLITGGHAGRHADIVIYASAELYDPVSRSFRSTGAMARIRHKHDAVLLADGRVLVAGGADARDDRGQYRDTEIYSAGVFHPGPEMIFDRYKHNGTSTPLGDGRILLAGGAARPEIYDPAAAGFRPVGGAAMMLGSFSAATRLADGSVLVTGGYGQGRGATAQAWLFRP